MGADGGILVLDKELTQEENDFLQPWLIAFSNESSWAAKEADEPEEYINNVIGYYGTDCAYSLEGILRDAQQIIYDEEKYPGKWNITWDELILDLITAPGGWEWNPESRDILKDLCKEMFWEIFLHQRWKEVPTPDKLPNVPPGTIIDWANQVIRILDGIYSIETWT